MEAYLVSSVRSHSNVSISSASETWIYTITEGSPPFFTVQTAAVGDIEGHDDCVTLPQEGYATADLIHNAHVLVA